MIKDILKALEVTKELMERASYDDNALSGPEIYIPVEDLKHIDATLNAILSLVKESNFEQSGSPFICGSAGKPDRFGLHDTYFICPTYGLDGMAVYTRTKDYSAPGY